MPDIKGKRLKELIQKLPHISSEEYFEQKALLSEEEKAVLEEILLKGYQHSIDKALEYQEMIFGQKSSKNKDPEKRAPRRKGNGGQSTRKRRLNDMIAAMEPVRTDDIYPAEYHSDPDFLKKYREIAPEISYIINMVPARFEKIELVGHNFVRIDDSEENTDPKTVRAVLPRMIPHGILSPSLASELIVQSDLMKTPLYRIEQYLNECLGLPLYRSLLSSWRIAIGDILAPLAKKMQQRLVRQKVRHCDETPYSVLSIAQNGGNKKCTVFAMASGKHEDVQIRTYTPAEHKGISEIGDLLDHNFEDYLITDGYQAYESVMAPGKRGGCNAHMIVRLTKTLKKMDDYKSWLKADRKTRESLRENNGSLDVLLSVRDYYTFLYAVESEIKEKNLSEEEVFRARQTYSLPVFDKISALMNEVAQYSAENSAIGKTASYFLEQEHALRLFLDVPVLSPDNNAAERGIKKVVMQRKNALFSQSMEGLEALCSIKTITETCIASHVNVRKYVEWVLQCYTDNGSKWDDSLLESCLPYNQIPEEFRLA